MKGRILKKVWDIFSDEENIQIKKRAQELRGQYLKLIVEFPDRPPVTLTGFGELPSSTTRQE